MEPDANPTRRQLFGSAAALVGAAVVARVAGIGSGGSVIDAANPAIGDAASALSPAERIGVPTTTTTVPAPSTIAVPPPGPGEVRFPLEPTPDCYVLDNYGDCRGSRLHQGVDILDEQGRPVVAVRAGELVKVYLNDGTAGFGWTLRGDDGLLYRYFHLDSFADGVDGEPLQEGDVVEYGQVIGYLGSTGNSTPDNFHLHFEVCTPRDDDDISGVPMNPLPLLAVPDGIAVGPPLRC
jgi:murein DD-endopeptidase MepM/ murein hydrolase activator NlpD